MYETTKTDCWMVWTDIEVPIQTFLEPMRPALLEAIVYMRWGIESHRNDKLPSTDIADHRAVLWQRDKKNVFIPFASSSSDRHLVPFCSQPFSCMHRWCSLTRRLSIADEQRRLAVQSRSPEEALCALS